MNTSTLKQIALEEQSKKAKNQSENILDMVKDGLSQYLIPSVKPENQNIIL